MSYEATIESTHWLTDTLVNFIPDPEDIDISGTPEEMIRQAGWEAFAISTGAGIAPGAWGLLTILPELIMITKLQIKLVYQIAKYYGKVEKLNRTIILNIYATTMGIDIDRVIMRKIGQRVIVKALSSSAIRKIAQQIDKRIGARILQRGVGRWVPILTAPVFGYFSMLMTEKIAYAADEVFLQEIEVEEADLDKKGYNMPEKQ